MVSLGSLIGVPWNCERWMKAKARINAESVGEFQPRVCLATLGT